MATNENLNTVGAVSTAIRLKSCETANWTLSASPLTGYLMIERGDDLKAMVARSALSGNGTGQFSGPGIFRFRLMQKAGAETVNVIIADPVQREVVINRVVALTQAQYDAITPEGCTMYLITG